MKGNGKKIKNTEKVDMNSSVLVNHMMDNGKKEKNMEKEKLFMLMGMFMRGNSRRVKETEKEQCFSLTDQKLKDFG